jgi:transcriptional regulator with XRE-family HTH domain
MARRLVCGTSGKQAAGVAPFPPDQALAAVLRELRADTGRSQEAVAHDVGITMGSYARIERGLADPKWSTLRRIAAVLGVTLSELARAVEARDDGES